MTVRRVLFVEANEDGSVGGSHQVLYDMMREMDRTRFDPVVLFYQDNRFASLCREAGLEVVTWDALRSRERALNQTGGALTKLGGLARAIARRRRFLRQERIDLVHMNNSPRTGRDDWLPAARLCGIPIVASARGDADPLPGNGLKVWVGRRLMREFDRVIAVSEYIATAMRAQGIPAPRVTVVHDGVDRSRLHANSNQSASERRTALREALEVPPDRVFVAAVGNIRAWKGQHVVLEGLLAMSPEARAKLCVVFIGAVREEDAAYYAGLLQTVAARGLKDVVRFAGPRTDVPDILSIADLMVHSSTTPEPGGTVVIESMTFGTPVVVASKGGHLDYLQEGLGRVYDVERPEELAAHLSALADNPEVRRQMAEGAKRRAADFSIERTARKMEAEYLRLLER